MITKWSLIHFTNIVSDLLDLYLFVFMNYVHIFTLNTAFETRIKN